MRNQVPVLVGVSAWVLFVEGLLAGDNSSVTQIGRFGPGAAASALTQGPGTLLAPAVALLLLVLYAVAAVLAGWVATMHRDVG